MIVCLFVVVWCLYAKNDEEVSEFDCLLQDEDMIFDVCESDDYLLVSCDSGMRFEMKMTKKVLRKTLIYTQNALLYVLRTTCLDAR